MVNPRSLLPDDQFVKTAPLYNNGSNGSQYNSSTALVSDRLLYEDPSLPFEIDVHPPVQPLIQPTNPRPPSAVTRTVGLQNVYQRREFLSGTVQSELAPGSMSPMDVYRPTELAVDDKLPASDHTKAAVTSNGPTHPTKKTRKRSAVDADSLRCDYPGCKTTQPFNRLYDRKRHVKSIQKSPGSHVCPHDGCHKPHNRKDNLQRHIRRHHQKATNADESSRGS